MRHEPILFPVFGISSLVMLGPVVLAPFSVVITLTLGSGKPQVESFVCNIRCPSKRSVSPSSSKPLARCLPRKKYFIALVQL